VDVTPPLRDVAEERVLGDLLVVHHDRIDVPVAEDPLPAARDDGDVLLPPPMSTVPASTAQTGVPSGTATSMPKWKLLRFSPSRGSLK